MLSNESVNRGVHALMSDHANISSIYGIMVLSLSRMAPPHTRYIHWVHASHKDGIS